MNPKSTLAGAKKINGGISFNAAIYTEFGYLYILGLRVWRGLIMPPATKSGATFYPMMYCGKDFAKWIYQQLIDLGWEERFSLDLKREDLAIDPIVMAITNYCKHYEKDIDTEAE